MGGKGGTTSYTRLRATNEKQRKKIKEEIINIIDNAVTTISVIALVKEPTKEPASNHKRKKKRKPKGY
jgi:hypothetical protein